MTTHAIEYLVRGRVDGEGRLVEAGEPLASLQLACGGTVDGPLAIPELREIAAFCRARDLILVSDEIHHDLIYPGQKHTAMPLAALLLAAAPPAFAQVKTITVPPQQPGASAPAVSQS
mgnify:CR=1 FL=1